MCSVHAQELRRGIQRLQQQRKEDERQTTGSPCGSDGVDAATSFRQPQTAFSHTLSTLSRLSASYRRCYWKSGAEMMFPIMFGHLTFASHRCWTVHIKKGVFLAAEAWRRRYGRSVLHAAKSAAGGEMVLRIRQGRDAYPLEGWRKVGEGEDAWYEGPDGARCATTRLPQLRQHVLRE